jgi:hypothetical protein
MPLNLGDLRSDPLRVARLPKLDVAGSSPVARSRSQCDCSSCENRLPTSAADFSSSNGPHNGPHGFAVWDRCDSQRGACAGKTLPLGYLQPVANSPGPRYGWRMPVAGAGRPADITRTRSCGRSLEGESVSAALGRVRVPPCPRDIAGNRRLRVSNTRRPSCDAPLADGVNAHRFGVPSWRLAEQPRVLPAELGRARVPDLVGDRLGAGSAREQQPARFL